MSLLAAENTGSALGMMAFGLLVGGFTFFCALQDYDWFMNNRRAALFVMIFGRTITRFIYMTLGLGFIGGGLFLSVATLMGK